MKKATKISLILFISGLTLMVSCEKENDDNQSLEPILLGCEVFNNNSSERITRLEDRGLDVDYIINCVMSVEIDLTIDPGVTIAFTNGAGLSISENGSVRAVGTSEKPIVFTGEDKVKGSWRGIISYSNDVKNRFEHCVVEYAGGGAFNSNNDLGSIILWANTYFRIQNTTIRDGAAYGINVNYTNNNVDFKDITISGHQIPFFTSDANIVSRISSVNFTGNTTDVIKVDNPIGRSVTSSHTWKDLGVPYRIGSIMRVSGGTLTIEPGVVVEFENGAGIRIGDSDESTFRAIGTQTNPIIFTGVNKVSGAWRNIDFHFTKSPLNEISYAVIEYAGNPDSGGAVYMWARPVVKVTNVTFKNIGTCGIYAAPDLSGALENLSASNNTFENVAGGNTCVGN
jgi:hypothetical protein